MFHYGEGCVLIFYRTCEQIVEDLLLTFILIFLNLSDANVVDRERYQKAVFISMQLFAHVCVYESHMYPSYILQIKIPMEISFHSDL